MNLFTFVDGPPVFKVMHAFGGSLHQYGGLTDTRHIRTLKYMYITFTYNSYKQLRSSRMILAWETLLGY